MKPFANIFGKPAEQVESLAPDETHRERVMTDDALRSVVGSAAVPGDLQLRLRLAMSRERVRAERRWTGRIAHSIHLLRENTLRRIALPIAGPGALLAAALLVVAGVGVTLGALTPAQAVEANDIPLSGFAAPHYLYSLPGDARPIRSVDQTPMMVEADVNSAGRVYRYRVLSGTVTPAGEQALRQHMLSSVFTPASFFGERVRGTVVLTFDGIDVHS